MELFDIILLYALSFIFMLLLVLYFYNRKKDNVQKRLSALFEEGKREKSARSPHLIIGILVIFARVLAKLLPMFVKLFKQKLSMTYLAKIEKNLQLTGYPFLLDAHAWHWMKSCAALFFFLIVLMISSGNENWSYMIYSLPMAFLGFFYPDYFLNTLLQKRKNKISRELPDAMDFLSLSLAAGMNFQLAVEEYVKRNTTLLADEFSVFINQIDVGVHRIDAFQHLLERNESPEMRNFLSSVIQSERLGTTLRPVIASQAEELRDKRKQYVEKMIAQAPVKMLFPMLFFIMPAMLIITLSAVLLPSSPSAAGYTLVEQNFMYLRVTPGIQVRVNREPYPVYTFQVMETDNELLIIPGNPDAMVNPTQKEWIQQYFKDRPQLKTASFIRLDLPYGKRIRWAIEFRSPDGKVETRLMTLKAIHFELEGFQGARMQTSSSKAQLKGRLTSGLDISMELNARPLEIRYSTSEIEKFTTPLLELRQGRNQLQINLSDQWGGELEKKYSIMYEGMSLKAEFKEKNETLLEEALLQGEGELGTVLVVMKRSGNRAVPIIELELVDDIRFSVPIALDIGVNEFQMFLRKGSQQSPTLRRSIVRKMSE